MTLDPAQYPTLAACAFWSWAETDTRFELGTAFPPHLVTNVHVVGSVGDSVLLCRSEREWFLPGGTLEQGEHWAQALDRELVEEAGARSLGVAPFGATRCVSRRDRPYRPWQPFPESLWLWVHGPVEIVGPPTSPQGGERILEVALLPVDDAVRRFTADQAILAELIRLSHDLHRS